MSFLPAFLRRRVLLARARELIAAGDEHAALTLLSEPLFDRSNAARELANQATLRLEARLHGGGQSAIRDLLARMRAEREERTRTATRSDRGAAPAHGPEASTTSAAVREGTTSAETDRGALDRAAAQRTSRFRLAIDDVGEFTTVAGSECVLGHVASARADLRFPGSIEREHARLVQSSDFHSGSSWRIVPIGAARVAVGGREVDAAGRALSDGDRVELGDNAVFEFMESDPASSSAILELLHGLECSGAPRILLLSMGREGRVRIDSTAARPLRVQASLHGVALELIENASSASALRLSLACAGGVERGPRPSASSPTSLSLLLPPERMERFTFGARGTDSAPFSIALSPLQDSG